MLKWWRNEPNATNRRASVWVTLPDGITPAPLATTFAAGDVKIRLGNALAFTNISGTFTNAGIDGCWIYEATQPETDTDGNQIELNVVKLYSGGPMTYYGRTNIGLEQPDRVAQAVWNVLVSVLTPAAGSMLELVLRPTGAVVFDAANTVTTFKTNLTGDPQKYKDAWCCFLDGTLTAQVHKVIAFDNSTQFLSFNVPFTQVPPDGTRFMLVNK